MVIGPDIRDQFGNPMDQNDNLVAGETPGDEYTLNFTVAGPQIVFAQPNNANTPIFSVTVGFNEPMDPATFTPDKTKLTGPNGDIPVWAVLPVAGTNFVLFNIVFPPSTTTGRYALLIGPDIRDLFGNAMDQNGDFIPGEASQDQFAVSFAAPGPKINSSVPHGSAVSAVDHVRLTFSTPMDAASFTPDKVASFIGPSGDAIPVTGVSVVPFTNNTQFDVLFDLVGLQGSYTMVIGPDIRDIYGNPMDQNGNLIPGEVPDDQYTAIFSVLGPQITSTTPSGLSPVLPPIDHLRVTFSRPMDPSTFTMDRITRFTGPNGDIDVAAIVPVPGTSNTQFDITFAPQGTTGRYSMSIDPVMDLYGNQTPKFTAQFGVQGPRIISNSVAQAKAGVDRIRVTFNEPMDPLTFTPDKIATFTGPAGPIAITDVIAVPGTNNTEFDILFDAQTTPGRYTMVIGPDIRDLFGNPMDQNNNLIPGETPGDQFTYHLTITAAGPGGGAQPPDACGKRTGAAGETGYMLAGLISGWLCDSWSSRHNELLP
jgi:hypothetical protein